MCFKSSGSGSCSQTNPPECLRCNEKLSCPDGLLGSLQRFYGDGERKSKPDTVKRVFNKKNEGINEDDLSSASESTVRVTGSFGSGSRIGGGFVRVTSRPLASKLKCLNSIYRKHCEYCYRTDTSFKCNPDFRKVCDMCKKEN